MDIQSQAGIGYTTLRFIGRLDATSSPAAEQKIDEVLSGGATVIILDLAGLAYMSSAGLRVILATAKKLSRLTGQLVLCGLQDGVRTVFEISGFVSIVKIVATEAEAAKLLAAK